MKQQSDFWYGLGVNQFLSACKVNLNAETTACLSVLTFRNFRLFRESLCHKVLLSYKNYLFDRFPDTLSAVLIHTILLISNEFEQIETIYMKKKSCMFRDYSSVTIVFAAFLLRPGDTVRISLMYLLDEILFYGASFQLLNGIPEVITGDTECHNKVEHLTNQSLFNRF